MVRAAKAVREMGNRKNTRLQSCLAGNNRPKNGDEPQNRVLAMFAPSLPGLHPEWTPCLAAVFAA